MCFPSFRDSQNGVRFWLLKMVENRSNYSSVRTIHDLCGTLYIEGRCIFENCCESIFTCFGEPFQANLWPTLFVVTEGPTRCSIFSRAGRGISFKPRWWLFIDVYICVNVHIRETNARNLSLDVHTYIRNASQNQLLPSRDCNSSIFSATGWATRARQCCASSFLSACALRIFTHSGSPTTTYTRFPTTCWKYRGLYAFFSALIRSSVYPRSWACWRSWLWLTPTTIPPQDCLKRSTIEVWHACRARGGTYSDQFSAIRWV